MPRVLHLYMDDSGTRTPDRKPLPYDPKQKQYFALGGVLIAEEKEAPARKLYDNFCERWSISYPLHSVEIRHRKRNFSWLKEGTPEERRFMVDLSKTLVAMEVIGIACVIDRPGYDARYREKYGRRVWHLCQTAFCIVVERAAKQALRESRKLRIYSERSSQKDEAKLRRYYDVMRRSGAPFQRESSSMYAPLDAVTLRTTLYDLKFKFKSSPMIQVADLYLWPIAMGGYDRNNLPLTVLREAGRLIECHLAEAEHSTRGTKYSCFELVDEHKRRA